ncbi:hypothetical protein [Humibacillus xanthopallidus]|uniref:hypothetical protein n=1 Tax=Humibacillus xanthopallidus TaxID=412689 RepID=UPI001150EB1C|nr:hypothetical protein [Humibacillus xanthopallidus]
MPKATGSSDASRGRKNSPAMATTMMPMTEKRTTAAPTALGAATQSSTSATAITSTTTAAAFVI